MPVEEKKKESKTKLDTPVIKSQLDVNKVEQVIKQHYSVDKLPGSPIAVSNRMKQHGDDMVNFRKGYKGVNKKFRIQNDDGAETDPEFTFPSSKVRSITNSLKNDKKDIRIKALQELTHFFVEPSSSLRKFVMEGDFMVYLEKFLKSEDHDEQYQAIWCVTNIAAGSPELCYKLLPIVPLLSEFLKGDNEEILNQTCWALGNMANDGSEFRKEIQKCNTIITLIEILDKNDQNSDLIRNVCFALSSLCRTPDSFAKEILDLDIVNKLNLHLKDDKQIGAYNEIYWLLVYLSAELDEVDTLLNKNSMKQMMVDHMSLLYSREKEALPLIRLFGNLFSQNQENVELFLNQPNFLKGLEKFLQSSDRVIKKESLWVLSNLTSSKKENVRLMVKEGILNQLLPIINQGNFDIRKEGGYSVLNCLANGSQDVSTEAVQSLIPGFMDFLKSKDYDMIELGLQYFISLIHYFPDLDFKIEEATFVKVIEDILLVFNDNEMQSLTNSLLNQYSDLLEKKGAEPVNKKNKME